jgi:signal peptidase I
VETKKRNPMLAPLLSIVAPGLGQIYNGQLVKGIILYLIGFSISIILSLAGLQFSFYGMIFALALLICIELFIVGDALFIALKKKEIVLRSFNKWYFYILFAILAFGIAEVTDRFVDTTKAFSMPSGSMIPTLMVGDHIIVHLEHHKINKVKRGDIIVFNYPKDPEGDFVVSKYQKNPEGDWIKRIIAVEGDVIQGKDKVIYLNGEELREPYVKHSDVNIRTDKYDTRDNFGPVKIPENKIFVMGDNRDQSYDSRYCGFVDVKDIKGKALYVYWAEDKSRIGKEIK